MAISSSHIELWSHLHDFLIRRISSLPCWCFLLTSLAHAINQSTETVTSNPSMFETNLSRVVYNFPSRRNRLFDTPIPFDTSSHKYTKITTTLSYNYKHRDENLFIFYISLKSTWIFRFQALKALSFIKTIKKFTCYFFERWLLNRFFQTCHLTEMLCYVSGLFQ